MSALFYVRNEALFLHTSAPPEPLLGFRHLWRNVPYLDSTLVCLVPWAGGALGGTGADSAAGVWGLGWRSVPWERPPWLALPAVGWIGLCLAPPFLRLPAPGGGTC